VLGFGVALGLTQAIGLIPWAQDAHVYWAANPGALYSKSWEWSASPYGYSPVFADALAPFRLIPERWFMGIWQFLLVAALAVTLRGWAALILGFDLVLLALGNSWGGFLLPDIAMGNIHVLLGACAIWGLRYPALWAFPLLSKVTPGIGLLWFVARGEWRKLAIAMFATVALALASFLLVPGDWFAWASFLYAGRPEEFPLWVIPISLPVRMAMAAALIVWGARRNRAWVLPIACLWCIPIPYLTMSAGMVMALGASRAAMSRGSGPAAEAARPTYPRSELGEAA
jgi:hypothetical protein